MNPRYSNVSKRAGHRCEYCRAPEILFNFQFEVEHIIPRAEGGEPDEDNLALSCRACNLHKSKWTTGIDRITGEVVRLFHPRRDRWADHFSVDFTLVIVGTSPIGRATVDRLRFNSTKQTSSRRKWRVLKLFP